MYKYQWQQEVEDFLCHRNGRVMEWIIDGKGIHLFIDNYEVDLEVKNF